MKVISLFFLTLLPVSYIQSEELCDACVRNLGTNEITPIHYMGVVGATLLAITTPFVIKELLQNYSVPYVGGGTFVLFGTTKFLLAHYKDYFPTDWSNKWHIAMPEKHHSYKRIPFYYAPAHVTYSEKKGDTITLVEFSSNNNRFFWGLSTGELAYYCYAFYLYHYSSVRFGQVNTLLNYCVHGAIIVYKLFDLYSDYNLSRLNRRET
jgi:hypothetical protein